MTSFKSTSKDLCDVVAEVARHLASQHVNPARLIIVLKITFIHPPGQEFRSKTGWDRRGVKAYHQQVPDDCAKE